MGLWRQASLRLTENIGSLPWSTPTLKTPFPCWDLTSLSLVTTIPMPFRLGTANCSSLDQDCLPVPRCLSAASYLLLLEVPKPWQISCSRKGTLEVPVTQMGDDGKVPDTWSEECPPSNTPLWRNAKNTKVALGCPSSAAVRGEETFFPFPHLLKEKKAALPEEEPFLEADLLVYGGLVCRWLLPTRQWLQNWIIFGWLSRFLLQRYHYI